MAQVKQALLIFTNKDLTAMEVGFLQIQKTGKQYEVYYQNYDNGKGAFMVRKGKKDMNLNDLLSTEDIERVQSAFNLKRWNNGSMYLNVNLYGWGR